MNTIDHTTADFHADILVRDYAAAPSKHGHIVYCRKINSKTAHFIISSRDGWYEFTTHCKHSAQLAADATAETLIEDWKSFA